MEKTKSKPNQATTDLFKRYMKLKGQSENEHLEEALLFQFKCLGVPDPIREYVFHSTRKWRLDFYWPGGWAVEVNGGGWKNGGHNRNALTLAKDYRKWNAAQEMGIRVLFYTGEMIKDGSAIKQIATIFKREGML